MMEHADKLWAKVDTLEEARIRHDERIHRLESDHQQMLAHVTRVETSMAEMREEIRDGFKAVGKRIDQSESDAREQAGYRIGQLDALKKFGLWVTIATLSASIFTWWISK